MMQTQAAYGLGSRGSNSEIVLEQVALALLIGTILQLAFLNCKLLTQSFLCGALNTQSPVSSAWRRRQRRNKWLQQVVDTALKLALIGSGTGLAILELGDTALDRTLYRLFSLNLTPSQSLFVPPIVDHSLGSMDDDKPCSWKRLREMPSSAFGTGSPARRGALHE
jgi:hypothetical protein